MKFSNLEIEGQLTIKLRMFSIVGGFFALSKVGHGKISNLTGPMAVDEDVRGFEPPMALDGRVMNEGHSLKSITNQNQYYLFGVLRRFRKYFNYTGMACILVVVN